MKGFMFRFGVYLKDKGEQWKCDWLIKQGFRIREYVLNNGVVAWKK